MSIFDKPKCPPHKFVDRVFGPFPPQLVEAYKEMLEEWASLMSNKVCRKCGWPKDE